MPGTLAVRIAPSVPAKSIGGSTYDPAPPFRRETLAELVVRMQRMRWRRVHTITRTLLPPEEIDLQALRTSTLGRWCRSNAGRAGRPVRCRLYLAAGDRARS